MVEATMDNQRAGWWAGMTDAATRAFGLRKSSVPKPETALLSPSRIDQKARAEITRQLAGQGQHPSTGQTALRATAVMAQILRNQLVS